MCSIINDMSGTLTPEEQKTALGACVYPCAEEKTGKIKLIEMLVEMKRVGAVYNAIMSGRAKIAMYCDEYFDLWIDGKLYRVEI